MPPSDGNPDPEQLTRALRQRAGELGFDLVGACPAVSPTGVSRFQDWLASGYAGQMHYLPARAEAYDHPRHVLEGCRSLLLLGMNYKTGEPQDCPAGHGRLASYSWGSDYHDLIHDRLKLLLQTHQQLAPAAAARGVVDTAPLLEREFAQLAGLGWVGKNTLLLNKQMGSWFFLAALLTECELVYDQPHTANHCGTCRACLDACPTDAFVEPYVLDSRRCISYLTIELRDHVPHDLRSGIGDWLFGCDVCQDVCPWNHQAPLSEEPTLRATDGENLPDLVALFDLTEEDFRRRFRKAPLWRSRRRGILRNAALVLGNQRHKPAVSALVKGLHDEEPLVRAASAWALGEFQKPETRRALEIRLEQEEDPTVLTELRQVLARQD